MGFDAIVVSALSSWGECVREDDNAVVTAV